MGTLSALCPRCQRHALCHTLLDADGAHDMCFGCLIELAAAVERVGTTHLVFSVERVLSPVDEP